MPTTETLSLLRNAPTSSLVQTFADFPPVAGGVCAGAVCDAVGPWDCDWPFGFWPYPYYDPYYADRYARSHSIGRITINLTVKLLSKPAEGTLDAKETEARLRKAYGSASFSLTRAGY